MNGSDAGGGTDHEQAAEWFIALVDLSEEERRRRLDGLRASDPELAEEVAALLRLDAGASVLDRQPSAGWVSGTASEPMARVGSGSAADERPDTLDPSSAGGAENDGRGRRIGGFELVGTLGRGGMGVVYRAKQTNPQRLVALKLVRSSLLAPDAARRLRFEADVLARLKHPGIAQIYDAGSLDDGGVEVSYFAMELVEGQTLVKHATSHEWSTADRVRAVAFVCDAVHHAHQRGVIHRDLKPANIVVGEDGRPRVLDFGVARLLEPDVQVTTAAYGDAAFVGTLAYMSPEQLSGDADSIDTRADVYALGAVLYELLTGRPPVRVEGMPLTRALEALRAERAPRPGQLAPGVDRDLETVTMKAIERDADRRYDSAAELGAELRRVLALEPVHARPATAAYRLNRFARRNPGLCAALGVAAVAGAIAIAGVAYGFAQSLERVETLEAANAEIAAEAERADAVNEFLRRMLVSADPLGETGRGRADMTVVEMLDRESGQIADAFAGSPASEASVRSTIGNVYLSLGRHDRAEPHLRRAVELHEAVWGDASADTDRARRDLAVLLSETDRAEEAMPIFREIVNRQRAEGRADDVEHAVTAARFGVVLIGAGEYAEAEELLRRAVEIFEGAGASRADALPAALNNLARSINSQGESAAAERMYERARDAFAALHGADHPSVAIADNNVATLKHARGEYAGAARSYRNVIATLGPLMGEDHPTVATVRHNLGFALFDMGDLPGALRAFEQATAAYTATYGPEHPETLTTREAGADTLLALGENERAAAEFGAIAESQLARNIDDARAQRSRFYRGMALVGLGESDEGERLMIDAAERYVELTGAGTATGQKLLRDLTRHHLDRGRVTAAAAVAADLDPNGAANRAVLERLSAASCG